MGSLPTSRDRGDWVATCSASGAFAPLEVDHDDLPRSHATNGVVLIYADTGPTLGLAVDSGDQIYTITLAAPDSPVPLAVDRISADLARRERFAWTVPVEEPFIVWGLEASSVDGDVLRTHRAHALAALRLGRMRSILPIVLFAFALGCDAGSSSVGTPPYSDDPQVLCERRQGEPLELEDVEPEPGPEPGRAATILWTRPLPTFPECERAGPCHSRIWSVLVDEEGITLAGVDGVFGAERAFPEVPWIARFDADGDLAFAVELPQLAVQLFSGRDITQWELRRDVDGSVLLVYAHGSNDPSRGARGQFHAFTVGPSGELTPAFEIGTTKAWPMAFALLDGDVLVASGDLPGVNPNIDRFSRGEQDLGRDGELRWSQQRLGAPALSPKCRDFAASAQEVSARHMGIDTRGRAWTLLQGAGRVHAVVQLDPSGRLVSDACVSAGLTGDTPFTIDLRTHDLLQLDGQDRALLRFHDALLRVESVADPEAPLRGSKISSWSEDGKSDWASDVALDAEDRIYVASLLGFPAGRRFAVDRISEDLSSREHFETDLVELYGPTIGGMWRAENGDIYMVAVEYAEDSARRVEYVARVRLEDAD